MREDRLQGTEPTDSAPTEPEYEVVGEVARRCGCAYATAPPAEHHKLRLAQLRPAPAQRRPPSGRSAHRRAAPPLPVASATVRARPPADPHIPPRRDPSPVGSGTEGVPLARVSRSAVRRSGVLAADGEGSAELAAEAVRGRPWRRHRGFPATVRTSRNLTFRPPPAGRAGKTTREDCLYGVFRAGVVWGFCTPSNDRARMRLRHGPPAWILGRGEAPYFPRDWSTRAIPSSTS